MSFRYVNPGYVYLLDSNVVATQITGNTYSKTGVAFTQTYSSAGVTIPQFAEGDDFWVKFDVYLNNSNELYLYVPNCDYSGLCIKTSGGNQTLRVRCNSTSYQIGYDSAEVLGIKLKALNTILLHARYNSTEKPAIEFCINDKWYNSPSDAQITYTTAQNKKMIIYTLYNTAYFSNVIISNEEISLKEQVIALPISATATDMTVGAGGMYTATAADQTLLQTPDITALAQQFSGESKITGVQVVGNPAYKTSTGLETMIGLSKSGNVTTEHGSYTLGTDSTALVRDGWSLSGVTLSDLPNMQFGWKTAD